MTKFLSAEMFPSVLIQFSRPYGFFPHSEKYRPKLGSSLVEFFATLPRTRQGAKWDYGYNTFLYKHLGRQGLVCAGGIT
ncbi:uncharacterized protein PgNI_03821 [Pyricularia grisea]|uniref:Uncharacterized protein n=1 Tax=Pyricularia grisea TaxID=148305 RepID=A0A6P8BAC3_PYRGI|nr:uncharacterized protein PgNI_03821 [Pyricularia grisea]TLD12768.1 hypothetical protein PgNI_03821 [Pyricularia grisea]